MPLRKSCAFIKYDSVAAAQRALRALGGLVLPDLTGALRCPAHHVLSGAVEQLLLLVV